MVIEPRSSDRHTMRGGEAGCQSRLTAWRPPPLRARARSPPPTMPSHHHGRPLALVVVLGAILLSGVAAYGPAFYAGARAAGGNQCSSQTGHFTFSKDPRSRSSALDVVAEECFDDEDYHPFPTQSYKVRSGWLRELSGLARSGIHNDVFWGHNDGKVNDIFAIRLGTDESIPEYAHRHQPGEVIVRAHLPSKIERQTDWEDIDNGLCPDDSGRSCLWIADTGDNSKRRNRQRIHVVVEPDVDMRHSNAGSGDFYDVHVCAKDFWTFQFEFEYADGETGVWTKGGSFDVEAMVVAPQGNKVWLFEKKQHWEKDVYKWPRIFESDDVAEALRQAGDSRDHARDGAKVIRIKMRQITTLPRACEKAPEAWEWLARQENAHFGRQIIESEAIATNIYKYKKMHQYGHRQGLIDMFMNGTDCSAFPPIFWMITGANLHPSGKRLAVQTYSGAFEYVFSEPLAFEELKHIKPRQLGLPRFDQIESIVYSHDGKSLFAIPESRGKKGWQDVEQITCKPKPKVSRPNETYAGTGVVSEDQGEDDVIAIRSVGQAPSNRTENVTTVDGIVPLEMWGHPEEKEKEREEEAGAHTATGAGVHFETEGDMDGIPQDWWPYLRGLGYSVGKKSKGAEEKKARAEESLSSWLSHQPSEAPESQHN